MDTSGQAAFISRIRSALGHSSDQRRHANGLFPGQFVRIGSDPWRHKGDLNELSYESPFSLEV
jgi:hypothetical protein